MKTRLDVIGVVFGFDAGDETRGACRDGSQSRKSKAVN